MTTMHTTPPSATQDTPASEPAIQTLVSPAAPLDTQAVGDAQNAVIPEPRTASGVKLATEFEADAATARADAFSYDNLYSLSAASSRPGGLVRGNLAVLIRYWTKEEGAAKVGWGRGGDFMRCVRKLSKYVPPNQVQGFCARLHKIATGKWPGAGKGRAH